MKLTRQERKQLRLAKKKRKFDKKREKLAAKNRAPKYIFCFACAGFGLVSFAICLSMIIQIYASYKYQTSVSKLKLPFMTGPCNINILIEYQGRAPDEITLTDLSTNEEIQDLIITNDIIDKQLNIKYDTNEININYELAVWPADNYELKYTINREPSDKYMRFDADFYTDNKNDLWFNIACAFEKYPEDLDFSITARTQNHGDIIIADKISQNIKHEINLSELARRKGIKINQTSEFRIAVSVPDDFNNNTTEPVKREINISYTDWPAYDPSSNHIYSLYDTNKYLE